MYLSLKEWADATGGQILSGDPATFVGGNSPGGLVIDSRILEPGEWFVAIIGRTGRDGHDYVEQAIRTGAGGIIISDEAVYGTLIKTNFPNLPVLLVPDTTIALGDAARALIKKFKAFVVAITGTVGKTSVKEYVAHIASTRWDVLKNMHNWNTEYGVPLTIFNIEPNHKVLILELASRGKGQIQYLSNIVQPDLAVITKIGEGHLSEFGSVIDVAEAKWEIAEGLRKNGLIIVNDNPEYDKKIRNRLSSKHKIVTFGSQPESDISLLSMAISADGMELKIGVNGKEQVTATIPGSSSADVQNALCAMAIAMNIKVGDEKNPETLSIKEIADALSTLPQIPGRMEKIIRPSGVEVIFDAYNSNPASLFNALSALARRTTLSDGSQVKRRVAIIGDMLELGVHQEKYHRDAGSIFKALPIDVLITVGKLAGIIRDSAEESRGFKIQGKHFGSTEECGKELSKWLELGDLVLIKASRALAFENLLKENW
jgi:UDP-N-acetylmuramoyl-tripeptide--D-alanyl-D-alanine ligase